MIAEMLAAMDLLPDRPQSVLLEGEPARHWPEPGGPYDYRLPKKHCPTCTCRTTGKRRR